MMASFNEWRSLIDGSVISGIPDTVVDDFEDGDKVAAGTEWSWVETGSISDGYSTVSVVTSPTLAGDYAGEASNNRGTEGWIAQRSSPVKITGVSTLIRQSNLTEQAGQWAIGKITGDLNNNGGFWNDMGDGDILPISRVKTLQDGSGQIDLFNQQTNIGTLSAGTNYKILWKEIDYSTETYDIEITKQSDGTVIASETDVPFNSSMDNADFFGFGNGASTGDVGGGTLSVYADDIKVSN
jgi:hypothetical protein